MILRISEHVDLAKIVFYYDTLFIRVSKLTFVEFGHCSFCVVRKTCISKTTYLKYVFEKMRIAKCPYAPGENIMCVCRKLDFTLIVFHNHDLDCQAPTTFLFSLSN